MGRKRPWQAIKTLILLDQNQVTTKSFFTQEEAIAHGVEWMQQHGPDDPWGGPMVHVLHQYNLNEWPRDELTPESFMLEWSYEYKALIQTTWPARTPDEHDEAVRRALDGAMRRPATTVEGDQEAPPARQSTVSQLLKIIAVAPGGDERLVGRDLGIDDSS